MCRFDQMVLLKNGKWSLGNINIVTTGLKHSWPCKLLRVGKRKEFIVALLLYSTRLLYSSANCMEMQKGPKTFVINYLYSGWRKTESLQTLRNYFLELNRDSFLRLFQWPLGNFAKLFLKYLQLVHNLILLSVMEVF